MQSYMAKNGDGDEQLLSTESGADNQLSAFGFDINGKTNQSILQIPRLTFSTLWNLKIKKELK